MNCPSCEGSGFHWSWCWRKWRRSAALGTIYFVFALLLLGLSRLASAQPYFREPDGGVRAWDAGRGWPNPDQDDRLKDYPPVRP